ncbi:MAG: transposase [Anaerolineae bacterium]|nr:transposase [Anaerolineae bacterium]
MPDQQQWPARKSPRLQGFDYASEGAYFITICVQNRMHLFGTVRDDKMHLNSAGEMVVTRWLEIAARYPHVDLDAFVIMPNHLHGIVLLEQQDVGLTQIIQWFKIVTTNRFIQGHRQHGWENFTGKLWQRSFHDHIVRSEVELNRIREYVMHNPALWTTDTLYS